MKWPWQHEDRDELAPETSVAEAEKNLEILPKDGVNSASLPRATEETDAR
jgi:hypothetical protein